MKRSFTMLAVLMVAAAGFTPHQGVNADQSRPTVCVEHFAGQTVRWIVPYRTGGGYDTYSRLMKPFLEQALDVQVVVENAEGASGRIGADMIKAAPADGLTVGIINGAGLLIAHLADDPQTPNPVTDFTILVRIDRHHHVWISAASSRFDSLERVLTAPEESVVFGLSGPVGSSSLNVAVSTWLLGVKPAYLTGLSGSKGRKLALLRGDIDIAPMNFETALSLVDSGEARVVLQVSRKPLSDHPALQGVPTLAEALSRQARQRGESTDAAEADAEALASLIGTGRLLVAPEGLDARISSCLEDAFYQILTSRQFEQAAEKSKRSVEPDSAGTVRQELTLAVDRAQLFLPVIRHTIERHRQQ